MEVSVLKNKNGFTIVELLISILILGFVIVSLLTAFSQQMQTDNNTNYKNTAITLAEAKIEECLKFPSSQINAIYNSPATNVDYIVMHAASRPIVSMDDPNINRQYKRTIEVTPDGNLSTITVTVEYGYIARNQDYPFSVVLTTQRGLL
jgi:Tfp pilus assembly protein PilV